VREAGKASSPGNAILYGTSRTFLERFGLKSLSDLPALEQFAPDEHTRQIIRERLSAASGNAESLELEATREQASQDVDDYDDDYDAELELAVELSE
jgi:segregation and condensation protein B